MSGANDFVVLTAGETSLILSCAIGGRARIVHWGKAIEAASPSLIEKLLTRQHAHGSVSEEVPISLLNEIGAGGLGAPGFTAHRSGLHWASVFEIVDLGRPSAHAVTITSEDARAQIRIRHLISLSPISEILRVETQVENIGENDLSIDWCAAGLLPIPDTAERLIGFTGRWAGEFQTEIIPAFTGTYLRENRAGRTSHDCFPGLLATEIAATETSGECFGFHFGWSGNARTRADRLVDGRAHVQMGEYFYPGECVLQPREMYAAPPIFAGYSSAGLSRLSQKFHTHVREEILDGRINRKPRSVHYNTWEAVYFDHSEAKLKDLATAAAHVGAERFILDDGWFGNRRSDAAGLGDWHVSPEVYPNGLGTLIKHVTGLGMEFGIWIEPEMVNPDSDLFRMHPDWVLQVEGAPQIKSRNQYVLDLTRQDSAEYLFGVINALLTEYEIAYIKWDMNRDVHHPGSSGRAAASKQTRAVYALIDRIRSAHPHVEIESCASGGGRADYGILQRTDRLWTSDSNDALDRQIIQRGASYFFPLEILGAHVGPETCHITKRRLPMELRVATALFGHMGMELNLLEESTETLAILQAGIRLYKQRRALLHSGDLFRLDTAKDVNAVGVVSKDRREALFSWCQMTGHQQTLPRRVRLTGLDPSKSYCLKAIWPQPLPVQSAPSIADALDLEGSGKSVPGETLMSLGFQAPLVYPETCIIYHLSAD